MYGHTDDVILVGIDGSTDAAIAAAWALTIARRTNSAVKAAAVWTERPPPYVPGIDDLVSEIHTRTVDVATSVPSRCRTRRHRGHCHAGTGH